MRLVLLVASIIALVIFTIAAFGAVSLSHPFGWLGVGLLLAVASLLPLPN